MIRINLAKSAGKKRRGVSPTAVCLIMTLSLMVGGVYYYINFLQDEYPLDELLAMFTASDESDGDTAVATTAAAFDKLRDSVADKLDGEDDNGADDPDTAAASPQKMLTEKTTPAPPEKTTAAPPEKTVPASPEKTAPPPTPPPEKIAAAPPEKAPPTQPQKKAAASAPTRPSSLVRSNMVEDVVKELGNETRAVSKLNAAYEEMTVAEKINYEVLFARNAFDLVTRSAPAGMRLRTLEIENFQTIYASGVGPSREIVQEIFTAFRNERGRILPVPLSHIKDDERGAFQFVITFKPRFGLELSDPFQALDHLGFRESLTTHLRNFSRLAATNGFKMSAAPRQVSNERTGSYRRVVYSVSGTSTYKDFHKFVLALHAEKVPCAFKKVTLTAIKDDQVRVNAEILFTVKQ